MAQYCIKRETVSFTRRGPQWRIVKEAPIFDTCDAARQYIETRYNGHRSFVVEVFVPKQEEVRGEFHCQICERQIEAKKGLIAHHGYQRPGQGWQTSSCCGARHKPYEVACDALPPAINAVREYIDRNEKFAADWKANPPRGIERTIKGQYPHRWEYKVTELRPAGFDPNQGYHYGESNYASLYRSEIAEAESNARYAKHDLDRLVKRLADWKPSTINS